MFEVTVKLEERLVTKFRGQGEMTIGRDPSCELMLDNLGVSRRHAQLREVGDRYVIEDLNSTNGIFVDSRRVTTVQVNPGDEIKIGKFVLTIQHAHEEPAGEQVFDIKSDDRDRRHGAAHRRAGRTAVRRFDHARCVPQDRMQLDQGHAGQLQGFLRHRGRGVERREAALQDVLFLDGAVLAGCGVVLALG